MATGKITKDPKPIYFAGTRDSQLTSGACYGYYHPDNNSVSLYVSFVSTNNITAASTLFTVPSQYRPSGAAYGVCMMMDASGGGCSVGDLVLNTSGQISQSASNSRRLGIGVMEYPI